MKKYDYVVYIGRFQPFHNGHLETVQTALSQAENIIILCGSANQPRTIKNPFTEDERAKMITMALLGTLGAGDVFDRVHISSTRDKRYNNQQWVQSVVDEVESIIRDKEDDPNTAKIAIIGHGKDESSFYLDLFPQWDSINMRNIAGINSTDIRKQLFTQTFEGQTENMPAAVYRWLNNFIKDEPEVYQTLVAEYAFIQSYKASWEAAPYAPIFVTADAVVIQSGHVLMIKRRAAPGAGLVAIPGGFVNQNETILDAAIRELKEETKIKVPVAVLRGSIKSSRVFDAPDRSLRGRTITQAFLIELAPGPLPKVRGSDDADKAMWIPLNELDESKCFEDHYAIVQYFLGNI